jgi:hypothetical protein
MISTLEKQFYTFPANNTHPPLPSIPTLINRAHNIFILTTYYHLEIF